MIELRKPTRVPPGRAFALIGAGMLALFLGACGKTTGQEHFQKAQQLQQKGDLASAVIELKNAVEKTPENWQAREQLAGIHLIIGDGPHAEKELLKARDRGAPADGVTMPLARAFLLQGKFSEALDLLKPLTAESVNNPAALALRGEAQLGLKQADAARASFARALELDARSAAAHVGQAKLNALSGNLDAAAQEVTAALASEPKHNEALLFQGELEMARQNPAQALTSFEQVMQNQLKGLKTLHGLMGQTGAARAALMLGKFDVAHTHLDALYKENPKNLQILYLKGTLAFEEKQFDTAGDLMQQILAASPDNLPAKVLLGAVKYQQGQYAQAAAHLDQYLAARPDDVRARKLLAMARMKMNSVGEAIATLSAGVDKSPQDAELLGMLGSASLRSGNVAQGKAYLEQALAIKPDLASLRAELGMAHLAAGSTDSAIAELERAAQDGKSGASAVPALVAAQLRKKDSAAALKTALDFVASNPNNAAAHLLLGNVHLALNDAPAGEAAFKKALQVDANYAPALLSLGRLALAQRQPDVARRSFQQAYDKDKKNLDALLGLTQVALLDGKVDVAVQHLTNAVEIDKTNPVPKVLLARTYLAKGDAAAGEKLVGELLTSHPGVPAVLLLAGQLQMNKKNFADAIKHLDKLIAKRPDAAIYHLRAQAQLGQKNTSGAQASLRKALELQPDYAPSAALLAQLLASGKQFAEASKVADRLAVARPNDPSGHILQGDLALAQRKPAAAEQAYTKAMRMQESAALVIRLFQARSQAGKTDASDVLTEYLKKHPDDSAVRLTLGSALQQGGQKKEALAHYQQVVKAEPDNVAALNNLAWLHYELGSPKEGLLHAEKAYERAKNSPAVIDTLGWLLVEQGELKRGEELLQEAARLAPDAGDIVYHHAAALHRLGKKDEARSELKRMLAKSDAFASRKEAEALLKTL